MADPEITIAADETVAMSVLKLDGDARMICNGCTMLLHEQGMLKIVRKWPIRSVGIKERCLGALYEIREPFTLGDCQAAIAARHVGRAWGL